MDPAISAVIMNKASVGYMILESQDTLNDPADMVIVEANDSIIKALKMKIPEERTILGNSLGSFLLEQIEAIILDSLRNDSSSENWTELLGCSCQAKVIKLDEKRSALVVINGANDTSKSERMKLRLLDNIPGMAYRCIFDRNWTMEYISDGCKGLTGYDPEELIQNSMISFNEVIQEEYRQNVWETLNVAASENRPYNLEYQIRTKDNRLKWVYEQGQAIYDIDGQIEALEGIIVDVTHQKKREEHINFLTYHDSMTGLYNRRYFTEVSSQLIFDDALPISVIIGDINGLKMINDAFGHEFGDCLIKESANILKESVRSSDIVTRIGGDEFAIFLPHTPKDTARTVLERIERGIMSYNEDNRDTPIKISISLGLDTVNTRDESLDEAIRNAEDIMYKNKLFEHRSSHNSILASIRGMLSRRGEMREENLSTLQCIAQKLGEELRLDEEMIQQLIILASIHDLGKVTIDSELLSKKEPLTNEEWEVLRRHPEMGYRIAMASMDLAAIADYILSHHERWDGKGYPSGLKGEEIPLLSRIIAIIDAYDAMTGGRPYRERLTREDAIVEIMDNAGTQFDPDLAEVFVRLLKSGEALC
ncbi:diguanylate cyclase [Gudongella oleilytica]|uniref:bifunctional diguanylate cyclase/phosphohydrolase n=1 Tax=Gudongella oleilytica TaxID=1582259 RepID=UPI002A367087|nr:diguanylate cyclase [Gudongella oleilytica]MDY0257081.1 diguanylate cyclase [Gudongella oleilytica]